LEEVRSRSKKFIVGRSKGKLVGNSRKLVLGSSRTEVGSGKLVSSWKLEEVGRSG
jgi:hypothetical protein